MAKIAFRNGLLGMAVPDSYIELEAPNTNQDGKNLLIGSTLGPMSGNKFRSIIKFDLSAIPYSAIDYATLTLYLRSNQGSHAAKARRVTQPGWSEGDVTWNEYKYATDWSVAGSDYTTTDEVDWTTPGTGSRFNITGLKTLVEDAIIERNDELHLVLMYASEGVTSITTLYDGDGTTSKRPLLTVGYTPY